MTAEALDPRPPGDRWPLLEVWDDDLTSADPLRFPGYLPPAAADESVRTGMIELNGSPAAVVECRFENEGGTMGAVAGERIVRPFARATQLGLPVVEVVATGGARLQE